MKATHGLDVFQKRAHLIKFGLCKKRQSYGKFEEIQWSFREGHV